MQPDNQNYPQESRFSQQIGARLSPAEIASNIVNGGGQRFTTKQVAPQTGNQVNSNYQENRPVGGYQFQPNQVYQVQQPPVQQNYTDANYQTSVNPQQMYVNPPVVKTEPVVRTTPPQPEDLLKTVEKLPLHKAEEYLAKIQDMVLQKKYNSYIPALLSLLGTIDRSGVDALSGPCILIVSKDNNLKGQFSLELASLVQMDPVTGESIYVNNNREVIAISKLPDERSNTDVFEETGETVNEDPGYTTPFTSDGKPWSNAINNVDNMTSVNTGNSIPEVFENNFDGDDEDNEDDGIGYTPLDYTNIHISTNPDAVKVSDITQNQVNKSPEAHTFFKTGLIDNTVGG